MRKHFPGKEKSGNFRQMLFIITVRNSSCGNVMFSQVCVKNSVHREGGCTTVTAADGTHPTGMHSCILVTLK